MADSQSTTDELFETKAILSDESDAAGDAVLARLDVGQHPVGGGYFLDLGATIQAHKPSAAALAAPSPSEAFKRTMVLTAILLSRTEKSLC